MSIYEQLLKSRFDTSLSASAERGRALISVVSLEDDDVVTFRILQLESSACRIVHTSDPLKGIPPARSECKSQWNYCIQEVHQKSQDIHSYQMEGN